MKIYPFIVVSCLFFLSCDKKNKTENAVTAIPLELKVERFDKIFFETPPKDLEKVKTAFPFFFPAGNDDSVWLDKMQDPIWREVHTEVQKKYADFEPVKADLELYCGIPAHWKGHHTRRCDLPKVKQLSGQAFTKLFDTQIIHFTVSTAH